MDRQAALTCLGILQAAPPRTELPDETVALWLKTLIEYPIDQARHAVERLINEDPHFPKIARFREVAGVFTPPRQELRWAGASACQICLGTGLVTDTEGRDWICNCASFGTMPRPALPRGGDVETPVFVSELRLGLARRGDAGGHNHRGPAPCPVCG